MLVAFRNPTTFLSACWIVLIVLLAFFGGLVAPHDSTTLNLGSSFKPPSFDHWFGTDQYGRDLLSRVMIGSRYALITAAIAVCVAAPIGSMLGLLAGFYGRWADAVLMRAIDGWLAFPSLILAMAVAVVLSPNITTSSVAIGVAAIPWYARTVRGETLSLRARDFVQAAHCLGARSERIFLRHILPNTWGPILVLIGLQIGSAIVTFAGLSFVGLGGQPPTPEWGLMVTEGRQYTISGEWWISTLPGLAIVFTVIAFNMIGDVVRDVLDPEIGM
ncbi:MAG: peptide/nickel transport system permease protein [Thermomicrobiales bacterium]|jgi:peptide/nickel transport system permease protein|nr:peptide/nickel transport system permease protein [Thermomicrobiales bacterium]MEA2531941.1 peptide/nickel transport system permease protein [Thermomicrobiales bacterium]MEA2585905.1 peptide/nickel transport system permease protein [Thermomicrobiales bacterium]MEA2596820.1 peptide/nickel transport system permease protein [Thermomicrobiales bacterium]